MVFYLLAIRNLIHTAIATPRSEGCYRQWIGRESNSQCQRFSLFYYYFFKGMRMFKITIASLLNKNKKYAAASKINGATGTTWDGWQLYVW